MSTSSSTLPSTTAVFSTSTVSSVSLIAIVSLSSTCSVTMAERNSQHVPKQGANDKRAINCYIGRNAEWKYIALSVNIYRENNSLITSY